MLLLCSFVLFLCWFCVAVLSCHYYIVILLLPYLCRIVIVDLKVARRVYYEDVCDALAEHMASPEITDQVRL